MIRKKILQQLQNTSSNVNGKGYYATFNENLLSSVLKDDFEKDLKQGAGNELDGKFRALHSSSALGVNFFGYFKRHRSKLSILGENNFYDNFQFEKKLRTGVSRPNLDVFLENDNCIIGIECKFLEHLSLKKPKIQDAYSDELLLRHDSGLQDVVNHYRKNSSGAYLDTAQLIKHAIGLINSKGAKHAKLVYLFWEPTNFEQFEIFKQHRIQLESFSKLMLDVKNIKFHSLSYSDLYHSLNSDLELHEHLGKFKDRYMFAIE